MIYQSIYGNTPNHYCYFYCTLYGFFLDMSDFEVWQEPDFILKSIENELTGCSNLFCSKTPDLYMVLLFIYLVGVF